MTLEAPSIEVGIKVGALTIDKIVALVVVGDFHENVLGGVIVNNLFSIRRPGSENVSVCDAWKDDDTELSLEIYPIQMPIEALKFASYLIAQRKLFDITFIVELNAAFSSLSNLRQAIQLDGLDNNDILRISAIDSGSIWLSLKSGAALSLRRLSSLFNEGATAKLAQKFADAKHAETKADIAAEKRKSTASNIMSEQEMLRSENIRKIYEVWIKEINSRIKFLDSQISAISDSSIKETLRLERDKALVELINQSLLPKVKNIPKLYVPPDGKLLLGPPLS